MSVDRRTAAHAPEVVVLEGIAGPPIDELASEFRLVHVDDLAGVPNLRSVRALIVRNVTCVDAETMARLPALEVVGRAGVGLERVDLVAARAAGVVVSHTPAANTASTAEHTLALALAVVRRIVQLDRLIRAGEWDRRYGRELTGGVWGVIGVGRIGRHVAALAHALGMDVLGFDPVVTDAELKRLGVRPASLEQLLAEASVVSLHVPFTDATHHLVGEGELRQMRTDAILVNAARGGLVDEAALADALREGRLAGAGLDVREREPPPPGDPLTAIETVVLTPHVGGLTEEAQARVLTQVAEDVGAVLRGEVALRSVTTPRPTPRVC